MRTTTWLRPARLAAILSICATAAGAQTDPRVGLRGGWMNAAEAAGNLKLVAHRARPEGLVNPEKPGDFGLMNSDLAFRGNLLFQGNFGGFQVWDISNPTSPKLRSKLVCPGGQ